MIGRPCFSALENGFKRIFLYQIVSVLVAVQQAGVIPFDFPGQRRELNSQAIA